MTLQEVQATKDKNQYIQSEKLVVWFFWLPGQND